MLLIEYLQNHDENRGLVVFVGDHRLAEYNGRDSIPEELNNRKVISVDPYGKDVKVEII